jgi:hypothetical protein
MAITWSELKNGKWEETGKVTHEGLVMDTFTRCDRVMSDIYSDERYASVWNPEINRVESVHLGGAFELNTRSGHAVVDILPEYLEIHIGQVEAEQRVREERDRKAREERARKQIEDDHNRPAKGKVMKVVRGRKVPHGTVGKVFWVKDDRVGLALSDEKDERGRHKDVAWVDAEYLVNTEPLQYPLPA